MQLEVRDLEVGCEGAIMSGADPTMSGWGFGHFNAESMNVQGLCSVSFPVLCRVDIRE